MIGKTFAHYKITEKIGAGGMGEVYRARDTKLDRDVAVKVLPEMLAHDDARLARFRREAKLLASFNHAQIATLHGLEESDGQLFLVMELVEGEDLSQRIRRGPIPVKEALRIAGEVAGALQEAHLQGIIHRDLKPANIKVTPDGNVKVLDFGLAKALEAEAGDPHISQSPTLAGSMGTVDGMILGTAAYMSPEQARGKTLDKRTDIWSLGCVIFEMLTGQHAFPGETVSDTIAKILEREPDWDALPHDTPQAIQVLLRRSLQKEQKQRLQDVGDLRIQIEEVLSGVTDSWTGPIVAASTPPRRQSPRMWMVTTVVAAMAAIGFAAAFFMRDTPVAQTMRATIMPAPTTTVLSSGDNAGPAEISPNGRMLTYVASSDDGKRMMWIRNLDDLEPRVVTGSENATFPFWSPDSRSIAFFADGKLKRVDLSGGLPISLCDALNGRGGTWGMKGTIIFSPRFQAALQIVPAAGGTPDDLAPLDREKHTTHRWPFFMPDGEHFIYMAANHDLGLGEHNAVYFATMDGDEAKLVVRTSTRAIYSAGHLLFLRDATLMAAPFDPATGELGTDAVPLPDEVAFDPTTWTATMSASSNGTLVYHGGGAASSKNRLSWFDRSGAEVEILDETAFYYSLNISPNDDRVAVVGGVNSVDIWAIDFARHIRTRLTFDSRPDQSPVWSPDQRYVAATKVRINAASEPSFIYRVNSTGGNEQKLVEVEKDNVWASDWSLDGKYLLVTVGDINDTWSDISVVRLSDDPAKLYPILATEFFERSGVFSPDGKWIAYVSDESGVDQVYVMPFVEPGDALAEQEPTSHKWQVSTTRGGVEPRWRGDGQELFFVRVNGELWSAEVDGEGDQFVIGEVKVLFRANLWNLGGIGYDVTSDGERFLINVFSYTTGSPITVVTNWLLALDEHR